MSKKKVVITGVVVVGLGAAWALFRPELLFINAPVNEAFPGAAQAAGSTPAPAGALASGSFHGVAHETRGTASIHQVAGKRVLRLTDFSTSNGPDLRVLLVKAEDASDSDSVKRAGSIEVGKLKGNVGDQNYDLPGGVDLSQHRAVTIWCNCFGVNFATAPLGRSGGPEKAQEPAPVATGKFHGVAHETRGTASIYKLPGGKSILRLIDFSTSNGPDLRVLLVKADDAADSDAVKKAGSIEVGKLKGNLGDQNYDLPEGVDLAQHRAVTIWCNRFGVNFATAPLAASTN
jgi:hypothetical protein